MNNMARHDDKHACVLFMLAMLVCIIVTFNGWVNTEFHQVLSKVELVYGVKRIMSMTDW